MGVSPLQKQTDPPEQPPYHEGHQLEKSYNEDEFDTVNWEALCFN